MTRIITNIVFLLVAVTFCTKSDAQSSPVRISVYGLALPKQRVTLRSSIDSHIRAIKVREGQAVKKGDLLIELDCRRALASRNVAKLAAEETGRKASAETELKYAKEYIAQVSQLYSKKAMNDREMKEAVLRWEKAQANYQIELERVAANQARLELTDAELQEHYLRAPFDGIVSRMIVGVGDSVVSNTDILVLMSLDQLRVELFLPYEQANLLQVDQVAQLRVENHYGNQQLLDAKIVFRSPMIEATTGTLRVVFEIDNRTLNLPAGLSVSVVDESNLEIENNGGVAARLTSSETSD